MQHAVTMSPEPGARSMSVPLTAFTAGAVVAVLIGVVGRVHDPTLDGTTTLGYSTVLAMKTVLSVAIAVLAVGQLVGALWLYGRLGRPAPSWLGTAHRAAGGLTVLLMIFVGYHCLWALGLEVGHLPDGEKVSLRTLVHGLLGCAVFGAVVVKVTAVRSRRAPGWFLPVAGGLLFALLMGVLLTSVAWYVTAKGWPA